MLGKALEYAGLEADERNSLLIPVPDVIFAENGQKSAKSGGINAKITVNFPVPGKSEGTTQFPAHVLRVARPERFELPTF